MLPGRDGLSVNSNNFNKALHEVCYGQEDDGPGFIDFGEKFAGSNISLHDGEVHLNAEGTRILTTATQNLLRARKALDGSQDAISSNPIQTIT